LRLSPFRFFDFVFPSGWSNLPTDAAAAGGFTDDEVTDDVCNACPPIKASSEYISSSPRSAIVAVFE
jgi:hypothetical protein